MKHFILLQMILLLTFGICNSQNSEFRIGTNENGKYVISNKVDKVKAHWKSIMKTQNNPQNISELAIISVVNQETRKTHYLIIGKNADGTFKIANEVYLKNNKFYFKESPVMGTISCEGCSSGCEPGIAGKYWFCTTGCDSNCTKTTTIKT